MSKNPKLAAVSDSTQQGEEWESYGSASLGVTDVHPLVVPDMCGKWAVKLVIEGGAMVLNPEAAGKKSPHRLRFFAERARSHP